MPAALISRDEVVKRILTVFRDYGFDGASLAEIAKATGLGKSSLYHYFPGGKDDMAAAVLDFVEVWMRERALAPLRAAGPPARRLRAMLKAVDELYDGGHNACVLGTLALGGARKRFQARLGEVFALWVDALRDLGVEAGSTRAEALQRAEDAVVRIEGALILAGAMGDPAPFKRALRHIERDLLT